MYRYKSNFFIILFTAVIFISVFGFVIKITHASFIGLTTKGLPGAGLNSGLVGWWTMDGKDNVNGVLLDRSGNGNNGNPSGIASSTFYAPGKIGQALNFDGVNDYVSVNESLLPLGNTARSFSMWVKTTHSSGAQVLMTYGKEIFSQEVQFYINTSGLVGFDYYGDGYAQGGHGNTTVDNNKWRHIVLTLTSAGLGTFYVDGVADGSHTFNGQGVINTVAFGRATIGIYHIDLVSSPQRGSIDDVRIYNRALSATEVKQLYNLNATKLGVSIPTSKPTTGLWSGLAGYWTFDGKDMANGVSLDKSGNGNNGNPSGIASSTFYTPGKIGQAFKFDGVNDYMSVVDMSALRVESSAFSVSAWVNFSSQPVSGKIMIMMFKAEADQSSNGFGFGYDNRTGTKQIDLFKGGVADQRVDYTFSNNTWYYITAVQNFLGGSPSSVTYYVNGVNVGSFSNSSNYQSSSGKALSIGAGNNTYIDGIPMNGSIDDVRIYNRALSATEVKQLYNLNATKLGVSIPTSKPTTGLWSGLAGYWTFDGKDTIWTSATAGTVTDRSGNANTGTLTNMILSSSPVAGKIGQGLKFNGSTQYVNVGTLGSLGSNLINGLSISAWVKSSNTSSIETIVGSAGPVDSTYQPLLLSLNRKSDFNTSAGSINFTLQRGQNPTNQITAGVNTNTGITNGKWHHVVATIVPGTKIIGIYLDGVLQNVTYSTQQTLVATIDFPFELYVGAVNVSGSAGQFTNGLIDDVRIYNRALSASEVLQLYNMGR